MKTSLIKIKRLESKNDLSLLRMGDVVMISVGSGRINDFYEYHGPAMFIEERLMGTNFQGWDFCRPKANLRNCLIGYHLLSEKIKITETGAVSSQNFFTYATTYSQIKDSGLI